MTYTIIERFDFRYGTGPSDDKVLGQFEAPSPREALAKTPYTILSENRIKCSSLDAPDAGQYYLVNSHSSRRLEFFRGTIDEFCQAHPALMGEVVNDQLREWYETNPANHPLTRHLFNQ